MRRFWWVWYAGFCSEPPHVMATRNMRIYGHELLLPTADESSPMHLWTDLGGEG